MTLVYATIVGRKGFPQYWNYLYTNDMTKIQNMRVFSIIYK